MSLQTIYPEKEDIEKQDISVLHNLVENLMKEIEFLREENAMLKKEDNPKRKAIISDNESEGSSNKPNFVDKPTPIIKSQSLVKKAYVSKTEETNYSSLTKRDMFQANRGVNFRIRGRGGRFGGNTRDFNQLYKEAPIFKQNDFPSLIDKSFKDSLFEKKQDYNYHCKMYLNNFLKLANKLNNEPQKIINEFEGYSTFSHEKVNQLVGLFNCDPNLIKAAYDYGLLHSVYTKDGSELQKIPEVYEQATYYLKITKATMIYVRFYGAVGEVSFDEIIHTTRLVKMGLTRDFILSESVKTQNQLCFEEVPEYLTKKRAWSLKIISDTIKEIMKTPFRLNFYKLNLVIVSNAREYDTEGPKVLEKLYWKILSPEDVDTKIFAKPYLSEKGFRYLCKNIYFDESHKCKYCGKGDTGVPKLIDFEDIQEGSSQVKKSKDDGSNDELA
ncbi:hypothetical protein Tco_0047638 [Tanacetum coccineum]